MAKFKQDGSFEERKCTTYMYRCPGCKDFHAINTKPAARNDVLIWEFNDDIDNPSVTPSIKFWSTGYCCHHFIKNGIIQYCTDCTHELKGKNIPLPDWDDEPRYGED